MGLSIADDSALLRCSPLSRSQEPNLLATAELGTLSNLFAQADDVKGDKVGEGEEESTCAPGRTSGKGESSPSRSPDGSIAPFLANPPLTIASGRLFVVTPVPVASEEAAEASPMTATTLSTPLEGGDGLWDSHQSSPSEKAEGAAAPTQGPAEPTESVGSSSSVGSEDRGLPSGGDQTARPPSWPEDVEEQEDAVMALLSLQRLQSTDRLVELGTRIAPPPGSKRRAVSPCAGDYTSQRFSPAPKPDSDARFFCKYQGCGKGYASTDAVRKHCRQRHLEWLRRLGHGCPALYCRWGDDHDAKP